MTLIRLGGVTKSFAAAARDAAPVTAVDDVTLEIAQDNGRGVEVVMQRVAVQTLLPKGTIKGL